MSEQTLDAVQKRVVLILALLYGPKAPIPTHSTRLSSGTTPTKESPSKQPFLAPFLSLATLRPPGCETAPAR